MSENATEREALQQHDQAGAPKRQPKAKAPAKKAEPKPSRPSLTATAKKHLAELTEQINKLEGLKADRLAITRKEHERGVPITEIAAAASYSVPRARQLLSK